ncbi:MAG: hypothetical protein QW666_01690 [Candidatus Woesearchaeota archaeon]
MKAKTIGMLCLLMILALAASAYALPVNIEQVKLDGNTLTEGATNRLDIEKNQEYDVTVKLAALENIKNADLQVFVSGFEYSKTDRAQDFEGPFHLDANSSRNFKLKIKFSDEFEKDDYLLRVMVTDRNTKEVEMASYKIKLDVPRNSLKIEDVVFYPENNVKDGEALLASVRVENNGDRNQEDVKVTITVPELNLAATSYINEIESNDEEETEEIYMVIPKCAEPGLHEVNIKVEYGEGHYSTTETRYINVAENKDCIKAAAAPTAEPAQPTGTEAQTPVKTSSTARKVLEVILVVLVVLLVIIGLIIGFSKLGNKEEEY